MKIFRLATGILAVIPIALLGYIILSSPTTSAWNPLSELVFLVFGVPILILNLWARVEPEIIEV